MEKQIRRTLKKCLDCGTAFYGGGPDKLYCDECVKKRKSNVIRIRICKMCGAEFPGGPRAYYSTAEAEQLSEDKVSEIQAWIQAVKNVRTGIE